MLQIYLNQSSSDVLLRNRPARRQKPVTIITGLTEPHKMLITSYRSFCTRQPT